MKPNVSDEGQNPVGGVLYLQRLVGIRMFFSSLLKNHTKTNASSRHHFPICRPRQSDDSFPCPTTARSACRAITRGSGGEHSTHIYSIPTSRLAGQQCRFHLLSATTGSLYGPTSCWDSDLLPQNFKPVCQLLPGFDRPAGHLGPVFHLAL